MPEHQSSNSTSPLKKRACLIRRAPWYLFAAAWTLAIILLAREVTEHQWRLFVEIVRAEANANIQKDITYRKWVAEHGGVYVPVTQKTQPNPYLSDIAGRDITTQDGKQLTLVNPAYMSRQVYEMQADANGSDGRVTSLNPLNPANTPDAWQTKALREIEHGHADYHEIIERNGVPYLFLMKPMTTEKSCLKCHAAQGYKEGDIRGGLISVVSMETYKAHFDGIKDLIFSAAFFLWLFGLIILTTMYNTIRRNARLENRFTQAMRASFDGIWDWNEKTGEIYVSPACYGMLGYETGEFKFSFTKWKELLHPDDLETTVHVFLSCVRGVSENFEAKCRLRRKDGGWHWVLLHGKAVSKNSSGRTERMVGVQLDISELKSYETRLAHSRDLIEYVLEHVPGNVAVLDRELRCIYASRRFKEGSGLGVSGVVGKEFAELFPEMPVKLKEACHAALEGAIETAEDDPYVTRDKSIGWTNWESRPWFEADGSVGGVIVYLEITTEAKIAREKLIKSEASLREAQHIALLGSWELDLVSNNLTCSDEVYKMFGIDKEKFGASYEAFLDAIHPEDREMVNNAYTGSLKDRKFYSITHRLLMPDGSIKHVQEKCVTSYNLQGTPLRSKGTVQDITAIVLAEEEKERLHEQLRQAQKMEAIGTLAGGIAHDFNNILAGILGYAELTSKKIPRASEEAEYVNEIITASQRAAQIVRHILTFSRRGAKKPVVADLRATVSEAMYLLKEVIPRTVLIQTDFCAEKLQVWSDPTEIHQIVLNLCTNAYQALPDRKGAIGVSLTRISFTKSQPLPHPDLRPGDYAALTVEDNGTGIDEAILKRIFEPYFTTKGIGEGTGLGLALVHGIVTDMKGAVDVKPRTGGGTKFTVYMPVRQCQAEEVKSSAQAIDPALNGRILFVEDELALANLGRKILKNLGYETVVETDPESALVIFQQDPFGFDLLVTDQLMPNMTGTELVARVRAIRSEIPVIMCSGFLDIDEEKVVAGLNLSAFLSKPYSATDLSAAINRLVKNTGSGLQPGTPGIQPGSVP